MNLYDPSCSSRRPGVHQHRALQDGRRIAERETLARQVPTDFIGLFARTTSMSRKELPLGDGFGDQPHAALVVCPDIGHRREVGDVHAPISHFALRGVQVADRRSCTGRFSSPLR